MRFLVDECVPLEITTLLQSKNFDTYDSRLEDFRGLSDDEIIKLASKENRIIITRDLDFNLVAAKKSRPKGIVLLRFPSELKVATIVRIFSNFMKSDMFPKCADKIVVISPAGTRIRKLTSY